MAKKPDPFDLQQFDEEYQSLSVEEKGDLPVGKYRAQITDANVHPSKSGQSTVITLEMKIIAMVGTESKYAGRKEWLNTPILPNRLQFIKNTLFNLGINCPLSEVPNVIHTLKEKEVEITIVMNENKADPDNPYRNVYVNPWNSPKTSTTYDTPSKQTKDTTSSKGSKQITKSQKEEPKEDYEDQEIPF